MSMGSGLIKTKYLSEYSQAEQLKMIPNTCPMPPYIKEHTSLHKLTDNDKHLYTHTNTCISHNVKAWPQEYVVVVYRVS